MKERRKRRNSGQMLVVLALTVALLFLSTVHYVFELTRNSNSAFSAPLRNQLSAVKLGSHHTVLSSLVNITRGGPTEILMENLEKWSQTVLQTHLSKIYSLEASPWNFTPYSSGIGINWSSDGFGVSSSRVKFHLTISGINAETTAEFNVNITTTVQVEGFATGPPTGQKEVELKIDLFNENTPALAQTFTMQYLNQSDWTPVPEYSQTNYGNGTYIIRFTVDVPGSTVEVSAGTFDLRGIFVLANTTCSTSS